MGAGTEVHSQTLDRESKLEVSIRSLLLEIWEPSGRKTVGIRGDGGQQHSPSKQLSRAHMAHRDLSSKHRSFMGLRQVLCAYVVVNSLVFFCGTPNSGCGCISNLFAYLFGSLLLLLGCLVQL